MSGALGPYALTPSSYETHRDILVSDHAVIATYTLDQDYITPITLADAESTTRKILHEGEVLALNPATGKVVPNYTSYGFGVLGVLLQYADAHNADAVVPVVMEGWVYEGYVTDNGVFGTVLAATKTSFGDRILFTSSDRL